jgi:hypothetical protein
VLNGILAGVVFLDALVRNRDSETFWIAVVPGVMWAAIWVARGWANNIDLEGLEKLKYNVRPYPPKLFLMSSIKGLRHRIPIVSS